MSSATSPICLSSFSSPDNVPLPCTYSRPTPVLEIGSHGYMRFQNPGSQKHSNSGSDFDWKGCHPPCQSRCSYHCWGGAKGAHHQSTTAIGSSHGLPVAITDTPLLSSPASHQRRPAPCPAKAPRPRCPAQRNI
ncbi:hypothetical protein LZ31DRAFT_314526 [Colletotrichum somersetense]|nr:hypothetical protein LZ31DRAFT_314526 [Colletotrichum somersetense]